MRKNVILFSPIYILTITWFFTLFLYFLNPFFLAPIRSYTWFVLLSGLGMIYIGFFTSKNLSQNFRINLTERIKCVNEYPFNIQKLKKLLFIITTISFIGIIGKNILIINAVGGLNKLILDPNYAREFILETDMGNSPVDPIAYKIYSYFGSIIFIGTILGGLLYTVPKSKLISIYPLFVSFIAALLTFQRAVLVQNYLIWFICGFIFIFYQPRRYQKKAIFSIIKHFIFFIFFIFIFSILMLIIRFFFTSQDNLILIFNSFYFYIAGNIILLDKYLLLDKPPLYGISLFRSFVSWFSAFGLVDKNLIMNPHYEFYPIYKTFGNTFSYIRVPYEDFKLLGVLIISYLWGGISFFIMKCYIDKFSFIRLSLAAMMIFSLFWSFYGFYWVNITSLIWRLFIIFLVDKYIRTSFILKD